MTKQKMTKREMFTALIGIVGALTPADDREADLAIDLVAGLRHEIELLDRKRGEKAPDAKKVAEQTALMDSIEIVLEDAPEPMRATAIAEALADGTTVQRVSAMLRKMVAVGRVKRIEDKKVTTFSLT